MKLSGLPTLIAVLAGATLALTACAPATSSNMPTDQPSNTRATTMHASGPEITSDPTAVSCADSNLAFGDTCEDQNHIQYTVDTPAQFTPTDDLQGPASAPSAVKMTITVYNGSDVIWDPGMFVITCAPGGGGAVIDPMSSVGWHDVDSDADQIAPGDGKTATVGCWTSDPASVQVNAGSGTLGGGIGHWAS